MSVRLSDFDYFLNPERIAQQPLEQRDRSRLMVLRRGNGRLEHRRFCQLPQMLEGGDVLVLNNTQVVPAKFRSRRTTGGRIDGLFLREERIGHWQVLLRGAVRCRPGQRLRLLGAEGSELELLEDQGDGQWRVAVRPTTPATDILPVAGITPLPPYIRRPDASRDALDRSRYQTIYASKPGAVAAPTAGLHFTNSLLAELTRAGVQTACLTLHVGLGTFAPVKTDRIADHKMHAEWYSFPADAAAKINAARRGGRRIVAVGTTSVRVIETLAASGGEFRPGTGWAELFLYPPAEFRAVDAMITNFHLPRSTLLMLVAAFCSPGKTDGIQKILGAYAEAIRLGYRFYSYGDAMLIV